MNSHHPIMQQARTLLSAPVDPVIQQAYADAKAGREQLASQLLQEQQQQSLRSVTAEADNLAQQIKMKEAAATAAIRRATHEAQVAIGESAPAAQSLAAILKSSALTRSDMTDALGRAREGANRLSDDVSERARGARDEVQRRASDTKTKLKGLTGPESREKALAWAKKNKKILGAGAAGVAGVGIAAAVLERRRRRRRKEREQSQKKESTALASQEADSPESREFDAQEMMSGLGGLAGVGAAGATALGAAAKLKRDVSELTKLKDEARKKALDAEGRKAGAEAGPKGLTGPESRGKALAWAKKNKKILGAGGIGGAAGLGIAALLRRGREKESQSPLAMRSVGLLGQEGPIQEVLLEDTAPTGYDRAARGILGGGIGGVAGLGAAGLASLSPAAMSKLFPRMGPINTRNRFMAAAGMGGMALGGLAGALSRRPVREGYDLYTGEEVPERTERQAQRLYEALDPSEGFTSMDLPDGMQAYAYKGSSAAYNDGMSDADMARSAIGGYSVVGGALGTTLAALLRYRHPRNIARGALLGMALGGLRGAADVLSPKESAASPTAYVDPYAPPMSDADATRTALGAYAAVGGSMGTIGGAVLGRRRLPRNLALGALGGAALGGLQGAVGILSAKESAASPATMLMQYQNAEGQGVQSIYEAGEDSTARQEYMRTHGMLPKGAVAGGAGAGLLGLVAALKGQAGGTMRRAGMGGMALGGLAALGGAAGLAKVRASAPLPEKTVRLLATESPDDEMVMDILRMQNNDLSPNRFEMRHGFVPSGISEGPYTIPEIDPTKTSARRVGLALAANSPWAVS